MDKIKKDVFKPDDGDQKRLFKDGDFEDKKNPNLEILHYWGLYANEKGKRVPMWLMVVNRKFKIKKVDNPYWHKKLPLFHIVWTEDEKPSYYGIGIAKIGKSSEERANSVVNIRTDIKKKNVRSGGRYNALDKKLKPKDLMDNTPGRMRPCSDINAAYAYDIPPPLSQDDYKEEETAVNDHREITGATASLQPTGDSKEQHKTLGGMQLLIAQSSERLKPDLVTMEVMGIRKMANRAFLLTRQFLSKPEAIELIASSDQKKRLHIEGIYKLSPKEIIGKMNFYSTGLSESIQKGNNIDKLFKYAEMTSKIPAMQQITNYEGIAKRIAMWLGFENIEDFIKINPDDPLAAALGLGGQQQPQPGQQQGQPQIGGGNGGLPPEIISRIAQGVQGAQ